ncbi:hypothetical protein LINGRAHAP2_LOCUS36329, partial [Linum grandiflorum]
KTNYFSFDFLISSINFFLFFLFQTKKPSSFSFMSEVGCKFQRRKSAVILDGGGSDNYTDDGGSYNDTDDGGS